MRNNLDPHGPSMMATALSISFEGVLKLVAEGVGVSAVQTLVITALAVDSEGLGLVPLKQKCCLNLEGLF